MEDNKLVEETEKTEETVEEPKGKFYTDEEFNQKVNEYADRRVARKMKKYEKELASYRDTENVLKSQLGGETIDEVNANLRKTYTDAGVKLPDKISVGLDDRDVEVLAKQDAEDTFNEGVEYAENEANKLASKGIDNMTPREKVYFQTLASKLKKSKDEDELLSIGATKELINDSKFKSFREMFSDKTPIKEIYKIYNETLPKKKVETPGSMVSHDDTNTVKDFYTHDEAIKFTRKQLDENPDLVKAIEKSMTKW